MCGISGVFAPANPPSITDLESMNRCQQHRGPDTEGYFLDGPVGLAHSRLSILDISGGDQPIENEDGSLVVVFNGEIYNYLELKDRLESAGHRFSTSTDTEVLVHLYEEYSNSFVNHLEGMFAFALWDREAEKLLLGRDQMGIKPLLLAADGDRVGFASELPVLLQSDVDQGSLDQNALSEYFSLGFIPAPRTAFENIKKVQPGELVVVSKSGIDRRRFYHPTINSVQSSFTEASSTLRELLTESVRKRLMSDVPLGAFLSGGIDSTITTGIMSQLHDEPIKTFTVGFESDRFDESDAARLVSQYHNTDHTAYTVSVDDVREVIPSVLDRLGEPFADPSLIPTYVVSRETSRNIKVALSGDGADELFAGYNRYRGEFYSKFYRSTPRPIRTMLIEPVVNHLPTSRSNAFGEVIRKGQEFVAVDADEVPARHFQWVQKTTDDAESVYQSCDPLRDGQEVIRIAHERNDELLPIDRQNPMTQIMTVDVFHGLPNQMLQKVDLASMYNSLEVRVPFLDTDIVEYAQGLPVSYKITARNRKRILKSTFDDMIPPKIKSRAKQGFEMPIGEWLKNELSSDFQSVVTRIDSPVVNNEAVLDIHQRHVSGNRDYEWLLWNIYVFAHWYSRMESEGYVS